MIMAQSIENLVNEQQPNELYKYRNNIVHIEATISTLLIDNYNTTNERENYTE